MILDQNYNKYENNKLKKFDFKIEKSFVGFG
jgi:hypothetical protein